MSQGACNYLFYKIGYNKRQKEFQNTPITLKVDDVLVGYVQKKNSCFIISIFNKESVKINK